MLRRLRVNRMAVTAYCPLALGRVAGDPTIARIAKAHGKTAAQVALRWLVQQPDVIAIPKTSHAGRLEENLAVYDFVLTDREVAEVGGLVQPGSRLINEPDWVAEWIANRYLWIYCRHLPIVASVPGLAGRVFTPEM